MAECSVQRGSRGLRSAGALVIVSGCLALAAALLLNSPEAPLCGVGSCTYHLEGDAVTTGRCGSSPKDPTKCYCFRSDAGADDRSVASVGQPQRGCGRTP